MSEPTGTEINIAEAVDATPAALAAAGSDLHHSATEQISHHADRVEREWVHLLEENRTQREELHAMALEIAALKTPPAPDPIVMVVEEVAPPAPVVEEVPVVEEIPVDTTPPAETEDQHEKTKRNRKPFGRR